MKLNRLHLVALSLAIVNALAGISLLLLSGWFIAASALAGFTAAAVVFNYLIPAATIRMLAIGRIASGYAEKAVGHHSLLERLHDSRLSWFMQVLAQGTQGPLRANQAEHLNQGIEDRANAWLSVIHPNAANLMILLLASALLFAFAPESLTIWASLLGLNAVLFALLYAAHGKAEQAKAAAQSRCRLQLEHQLAQAPLWLLSSRLEKGEPLFHTLKLWLKRLGVQRRLDASGEALILWLSGLAIVLLLGLLPEAGYGSAFIMLPVILWLAMPEWLGNSFRAIRPLLGAQNATSHEAQVPQLVEQKHTSQPFTDLSLKSYGWCYESLKGEPLTAEFNQPQLIWLKGSSGSGKSSLLQALIGTVDEQGEASLNNQPLASLNTSKRQQTLHYVEQFPYVLSDTLENNLRLASPDASQEQLLHALEFAELKQLTDSLSDWVGESGRALSGGEIKRLGLARANLLDRPVWLLDEPFEGLDEARQLKLALKLKALSQTKLIILASHLWPEPVTADQIIDLDR